VSFFPSSLFTAAAFCVAAPLASAQNDTLFSPKPTVPPPTTAAAQAPEGTTFAGWHFTPGGTAAGFKVVAGQIQRLPFQPGIGLRSVGLRANGEVTGTLDLTIGGQAVNHAFRSNSVQGTVDLGTLGGTNSWGANTSGDGPLIAGTSERTDGSLRGFRIVNVSDPLEELVGLGGTDAGATASNDTTVVGWAENAGGQRRAVYWDAAGAINDLGTLGGNQAQANYIAANGMICGWAETSTGEQHAFLWDPALPGSMLDLGTLGGSNSEALGMNEVGDVVGTAQRANAADAAFRWSASEGMLDLQDRLLPSSPWTFTLASGISNEGTVIGSAFQTPGANHLFQLRPLRLEITGGLAGTTLFGQVDGAGSGSQVTLIQGSTAGTLAVPGCPPGLDLAATDPVILAVLPVDGEGSVDFQGPVPVSLSGMTFLYQVVDTRFCAVSPALWITH